ncbi:hypothetical protein JCM18899A_41750 [Nocardioides sp. AN3]
MSTSSKPSPSTTPATPEELRLHLAEVADLVDHLPTTHGRISRMVLSRPDWDDSSTDGRGVRSIRAARGRVEVGSFPRDDTHLRILTMSSGRRHRLLVSRSETPDPGADVSATDSDGAVDRARGDDESPAGWPAHDGDPPWHT